MPEAALPCLLAGLHTRRWGEAPDDGLRRTWGHPRGKYRLRGAGAVRLLPFLRSQNRASAAARLSSQLRNGVLFVLHVLVE